MDARYVPNCDWTQLDRHLADMRRPLLVSHTRPDSDALGSIAALDLLLADQGVDPVPLLYEPLPDRFAFFDKYPRFKVLPSGVTGGVDVEHSIATICEGACDGVVLLDTCAIAQIQPVADWIVGCKLPTVAIDHHATRDDLVQFACVDVTAAATCLMLYEWARASGRELSRPIAEALFVGIATDTGWFRHANTDARALHAAAGLVDHGVVVNELFRWLYERDSRARIRLLGAAIDSLELAAASQVAIMAVPEAVMHGLGAAPADTEDIINTPLRIGSVVCSVLLVEHEKGRVRASLRSKPPASADDPDIDVAAIAARFDGGGHRRAAGARFAGTIASARAALLSAIEEVLAQCD